MGSHRLQAAVGAGDAAFACVETDRFAVVDEARVGDRSDSSRPQVVGVAKKQTRCRDGAMTAATPRCTQGTLAACSREEPMPKCGARGDHVAAARTVARKFRGARASRQCGAMPSMPSFMVGAGGQHVGVNIGAQAPDAVCARRVQAGHAATSDIISRGSQMRPAHGRCRHGVGRGQVDHRCRANPCGHLKLRAVLEITLRCLRGCESP